MTTFSAAPASNPVASWFEQDFSRCFLIAEVAQTHDGSLGLAHAFVDAAADAGADAIKFQTHIAASESTPAEPWRVKFSFQDETRYDYWKRMEFKEANWLELRDHASDRGISFLSTPFSIEAVELLDRIGVPAWKVASGEVANLELLRAMAARGPVLISSGLSSMEEIDLAVTTVRDEGAPFGVMQCTTSYPTSAEQVGLNLIDDFRRRWNAPVGLSDHSGTIFPVLAAATLGAQVAEVHLTLSRWMFGPDVPASVTVEELALIRRGLEFIDLMRSNPVDKDISADSTAHLRALFSRSLVAARELPSGHSLTPADLTTRKPGTGIPPSDIGRVLGRVTRRTIHEAELLSLDDLEDSH